MQIKAKIVLDNVYILLKSTFKYQITEEHTICIEKFSQFYNK